MRDDAFPPPTTGGGARCLDCTSPLADEQRYCLACGASVADVVSAVTAGAPPRATAPAPALRSRIPLPGGARGAGIALAGALAIGVLAGAVAGPAGPAVAGRRVVVAAPVAAPDGAASTTAPGDLGTLQTAAPKRPAVVANAAPATSPAVPVQRAAAAHAAPAAPRRHPAAQPAPAPKPAPKVAGTPPTKRPPVKHVVVVALAGAGFDEAFGPRSPAPYLARDLRAKGVLLRRYHAIAHGNLPNLIALLSGQGSNPATDAGCAEMTPFVAAGKPAADGQLRGKGCVFGAGVPTLPAQLEHRRLAWRAYADGAGQAPDAPPGPCQRPAPAPDGSPLPVDRNPLLFFGGLASAPDCTGRVTGLAPLAADLAAPAAQAPAFTLLLPGACDAGREGACPAGEPAGLARADAWLREWVPQLLAAPAFADDGLVVVTFAEARATGKLADFASCCGPPRAINEPPSVDPQAPPAGGGRVGAIVLSPHAKPGTVSDVPYNHLALLRTIEDAFGLGHLALAGAPDLRPLGADVFGDAR
ncbi:MAG TPA: alkaline phosphatase family protein [Solirubrobacteraceae bacterium]